MGLLQKFTKNIGVRHVQVVIIFFGYMISFSIRSLMGVAIIAMTDHNITREGAEVYDWTHSEHVLIRSSLLWGCMLSQLPSGYVMNYSGYHKFLVFGVLFSSILTMFTPVIAECTGWIGVLCSRFFVGIGQGCLVPGVKGMIAKWIPVSERPMLASFVLSAPELGNVIATILSGVLAESMLGWPSIFYDFATAGIIWSIIFFCWGCDSPEVHGIISPEEREYILSSLGEHKPQPFPWKAAFSSTAVWALIIANLCNTWNYYMLLAELPTYMNYVLHYSTSESCFLSALLLLGRWLFAFPVGWVAKYFLERGISVPVIRKTCNSLALWAPGVALLILCVSRTDDQLTAVLLMTIVVGFNSAIVCGQEINEIDIAPNFVGILSAVTNTAGKIFGSLSILAFFTIVKNPTSIDQWNIMFYTSVVLFFIGNLAFLVFGKAEILPWNAGVENEDCALEKVAVEKSKKSKISRISSIRES